MKKIYIQCYCFAIYLFNEKLSLLKFLSYKSSRYRDYLIKKKYATKTSDGDIDISKALDFSVSAWAGIVEYSFMSAGGLFIPICLTLFNKYLSFLPRSTSLLAVVVPFTISFSLCQRWIGRNNEWKLEYNRIKELNSFARKKIGVRCLLILIIFAILVILNFRLI